MKRTSNVNDVHESSWLSEMKDAYEKLHCQCLVGVEDTSRWRVLLFKDVCREYYAGRACRDFIGFEKDHPFKNKAAHRALKKNLKYRSSTSAKTCLSALIRFDMVIIDITHSHSFCLPNIQFPDESSLQSENFGRWIGENSKVKSNKDGKISGESIRRMKDFLPVAASNLLTSCFETFRNTCIKDTGLFCLENSVTPSCSWDELMHSVGQKRMDF